MIDIFLRDDVAKLLQKKKVVFIGDSNMRAIYKDVIVLSQNNKLAGQQMLKVKMEKTFCGDILVYHGKKSNGRDYREEREYTQEQFNFFFYFITRVYGEYAEDLLACLKLRSPDIVVINSCVWDITRWGPKGVEEYKKNLKTLMKKLKHVLHDNCLVIWLTTPPVSQNMRGGFLVPQLEFLKYSLRFHVMEANYYARQVMVENGFDTLDVHYNLRMQLSLRAKDGIHWLPLAVRHITNLLLTHISLAWNVPLPHRFTSDTSQENGSTVKSEPSKMTASASPLYSNNSFGSNKECGSGFRNENTHPSFDNAPSTSGMHRGSNKRNNIDYSEAKRLNPPKKHADNCSQGERSTFSNSYYEPNRELPPVFHSYENSFYNGEGYIPQVLESLANTSIPSSHYSFVHNNNNSVTNTRNWQSLSISVEPFSFSNRELSHRSVNFRPSSCFWYKKKAKKCKRLRRK